MCKPRSLVRSAALALSAVIVAACGGSDGDGGLLGGGFSDRDDLLTWRQGVYLDKTVYQAYCASPRTGADPFNDGRPYPDRQGTVADENFFLRSWTDELYLWYDEVEDQDPNLFTTAEYFALLKTNELTPSNRPKDNFHFSENTQDYLSNTVSGVSFGYGMGLVINSPVPPREVIVRDVVPASPADLAGIERGMTILTVDGADLVNGGDQATVDVLNAGLFPSASGESHSFGVRAYGSQETQEFNLVSSSVTSQPVKEAIVVSTASGDVGYLHFNSHIAPAEIDLFDAFSQLQSEGVTDLVLDLRYNGGGLLDIAGQVGYMIAGGANTNNENFYQLRFNDKHPDTDPVTGASLDPIPFFSTSRGFSEGFAAGTSLPSLNLSRVFILAAGGTCSASEAIINGLRGADVEVILLGGTTCGKPYGFYPQDNCGTTYFSVQFTGVNDDGFGEYPDGFSPANMPAAPGVPVTGCWVEDDFSRALGDPQEGMFAAALQYRESGTCPPLPPVAEKTAAAEPREKARRGLQIRAPERPGLNNAILTP